VFFTEVGDVTLQRGFVPMHGEPVQASGTERAARGRRTGQEATKVRPRSLWCDSACGHERVYGRLANQGNQVVVA
jgi:hypothetical protein